MAWLNAHWGYLLNLSGYHLFLAMIPVLVGFVISIPLGWAAMRSGVVRGAIFYIFGFLYSLPSLVLLVVLPAILQTQILDPVNLLVALTVYTVALLVRSVVDALGSVPAEVRMAATAMGFRPVRLFFAVDLPMSVPVLVAGLRVASVSSISLVSVGSLLGIGGLGDLFTDGFHRDFVGEIVVGIVASLVLALAMDVLLVLIGRFATPWTRTRTR